MKAADLGQEDSEGTGHPSQRKGTLLWGVVTTQGLMQKLRSPAGRGIQILCSCQEEPPWQPGFSRTQLGKRAIQQLCVREHTPSPGKKCEGAYSQVQNHRHARDCSGLPRSYSINLLKAGSDQRQLSTSGRWKQKALAWSPRTTIPLAEGVRLFFCPCNKDSECAFKNRY